MEIIPRNIYIAHSPSKTNYVEEMFISKLREHFTIINPFGKTRKEGLEKWVDDKAFRYKYFKELKFQPNWIVTHDLLKLRESDAIFVYFDKPSIGCAMELYHASVLLNIPSLVVVSDCVMADHPWLQVYSTLLGNIKEFPIMLERLIEWWDIYE